eukprot:SAG31_NODE_5095_length_2747_cov_1.575151_3_plen_411_part_00
MQRRERIRSSENAASSRQRSLEALGQKIKAVSSFVVEQLNSMEQATDHRLDVIEQQVSFLGSFMNGERRVAASAAAAAKLNQGVLDAADSSGAHLDDERLLSALEARMLRAAREEVAGTLRDFRRDVLGKELPAVFLSVSAASEQTLEAIRSLESEIAAKGAATETRVHALEAAASAVAQTAPSGAGSAVVGDENSTSDRLAAEMARQQERISVVEKELATLAASELESRKAARQVAAEVAAEVAFKKARAVAQKFGSQLASEIERPPLQASDSKKGSKVSSGLLEAELESQARRLATLEQALPSNNSVLGASVGLAGTIANGGSSRSGPAMDAFPHTELARQIGALEAQFNGLGARHPTHAQHQQLSEQLASSMEDLARRVGVLKREQASADQLLSRCALRMPSTVVHS